ncbi:hypothetical protein BD324DRAFT_581607 [Kockovaella imperatae]|uniref:Phosphatidic acid phosphatase type 2/haloperoxidase domain-containing protein n=1 Tax=Kockovaella imperatae TaxID=4999 RepID=A0A1Y1UC90_9TREE|nr:hypothetical protein BD324DRAFT_581607 [Kockovaella imperatae]ORX35629.1 hypothetical protein BD324DRAFT_581607 [Kockovaella imperatae]
MIFSPFIRLFRRIAPSGLPTALPSISTPLGPPSSQTSNSVPLLLLVTSALQRLDLSTDPRKTIRKISKADLTLPRLLPYIFFGLDALYCLYIMRVSILLKLAIPTLYALAILLPFSSQLIWPATPVLTWALTFFTARFIPSSHRPEIHVALLPALESVLYGANISDLQTRYTNSFMDVMAWIPYGVLHFSLPIIVALILWAVGPKGAPQYWGKAFGWMNLVGVLTQILIPCAAPWYEIIHGLTPANYAMPGSPGGLLRIDRVLHTSTYTNAFGAAPLVFGAFPSLHSGCAVMEALFMSHFFPRFKPVYWGYVGVLWWATMYLSHHYLIDLTAGACLSVIVFYITMPPQFKDVDQIIWSREQGGAGVPMFQATTGPDAGPLAVGGSSGLEGMQHRDERQTASFEARLERIERHEGGDDNDDEGEEATERGDGVEPDEEARVEGKAQEGGSGHPARVKRNVSWGETKVLGEEAGRRKNENASDGV